MATDMSPEAVARRLQRVAELYVPESPEEARRRFAERTPRAETFDQAVARRLDELRALLELTEVLQRAPQTPKQSPKQTPKQIPKQR
jgi:predicted component of type VI protein secretion system